MARGEGPPEMDGLKRRLNRDRWTKKRTSRDGWSKREPSVDDGQKRGSNRVVDTLVQ